MSRPKCLRCGATSEWIEGKVPNELAESSFALSYDDLQEIHKLTSMVCGWKMSLPSKMITQAQEVHRRVINLETVKANQGRD